MLNKKLFIMNLIYFITLALVAIVFALSSLGLMENEILANLFLQLVIVSGVPLLLYTCLISKNIKTTFKDFGYKKMTVKIILLVILIGIVLHFINVFVSTFFNTALILFGFENFIPVLNVGNGVVLKEVLMSACLPALCEEVIHRGMMLNASRKIGFTKYGLIFSSILFGLMHLNIVQFFYATILGFLIGITVIATDSIWAGVIIHFINNFLSIYFSFNNHWPLQNLYENLLNLLSKISVSTFIFLISICMGLLIMAFISLLKLIYKVKAQERTKNIISKIDLTGLAETQAKEKISQVNLILAELTQKNRLNIIDKKKICFIDKIFLISAIVIGACGTLGSLISGLI